MIKEVEVCSCVENIRLDKFLSEIFNQFSRAHVSKLIASKDVSVNNREVKASYLIKKKDRIVLRLKPPQAISLKPENIEIEIVFQDEYIAVVNKPAGMVVHPSAGHFNKTLVNALLYHLDNLSGINNELRPGIVHRLDKDTSGLMVIAKNDTAHLSLSEQFKKRKVKKFYKALMFGRVVPATGKIETLLGRHKKNRLKFSSFTKNGKIAITGYKVEKYYKNFSLLDVNIETGRTHQIRVHFSEKGFPIVGDSLYGTKKINNKISTNEKKYLANFKRVFLHSYKLTFFHPKNRLQMDFTIGLPDELKKILEVINGD